MIDWSLFIPACFALNLAFGPNNLLAMNHGAAVGVGFAQRAAIGRLLVFAPMIAITALGLGLLLTASATLFTLVKTLGALYLLWLGIRLWRSASQLSTTARETRAPTLRAAFRAEALVASSNPKAILIFAAFFPQFVPTDGYWTGYALLGACFLCLEAVAILVYASAGRYASRLAAHRLGMLQRGSGLTMCLFGLALLASPSPSSR